MILVLHTYLLVLSLLAVFIFIILNTIKLKANHTYVWLCLVDVNSFRTLILELETAHSPFSSRAVDHMRYSY